jgi:hypothetical protein
VTTDAAGVRLNRLGEVGDRLETLERTLDTARSALADIDHTKPMHAGRLARLERALNDCRDAGLNARTSAQPIISAGVGA